MDTDARGTSPGRDRERARRGERSGSRFDNNDRDRSRERGKDTRRVYVSKYVYCFKVNSGLIFPLKICSSFLITNHSPSFLAYLSKRDGKI